MIGRDGCRSKGKADNHTTDNDAIQVNQDSSDESQIGGNIHVFPALRQGRREAPTGVKRMTIGRLTLAVTV